jgi:hypothetical protein
MQSSLAEKDLCTSGKRFAKVLLKFLNRDSPDQVAPHQIAVAMKVQQPQVRV